MRSTQEGVDTLNDLTEATTAIGIAEVLRCIMTEFKGPAGFAKELKLDFDKNNKGSANRIRIETAIIAALQKLDAGDDDGDDDIEHLETVARQLMAAETDDADA